MSKPEKTLIPKPGLDWHSTHKAGLSRGDKAADVVRNGMGSWAFVGSFLLFMAIWAAINSIHGISWDPYPFILLNLFLSLLAGLQGAILLIAAKRQDGISAALSQNDYDTNVAAKNDIEALMAINEQQLVIIQDLQLIMSRLDKIEEAEE
jgi:uncharacterized membrane protein